MSGAQQVYATIKRSSKYRYQQPTQIVGGQGSVRRRDVPFTVTFNTMALGGDYGVRGNDNQYRVQDLNFYVRLDAGPTPEWPRFVSLK